MVNNKNIEVSYILPHNNREELLEYNLKSLLCQTVKDFEIIITDNSLNKEKIKNVVSKYLKLGLNIKLYFVDPRLCKFSHDGTLYQNKFCPAVQQNVGVKKAHGKIIVLTSPEVINAATNVENIIKKFNDNASRFLLGWMDEMKKEETEDIIKNKYKLGDMQKLCENNVRDPLRGGAWCKQDCWRPTLYFLGCMLREDFIKIGGIEESFMAGIAWEDDEFSRRCIRNSIICSFEGSIGGIHLSHSRKYQEEDPFSYYSINGILNKKINNFRANRNHDWGSDSYIMRE